MTTTYYELTPRGIRAIHPQFQHRTQTYATLAAARAARYPAATKPHYKYSAAVFADARNYKWHRIDCCGDSLTEAAENAKIYRELFMPRAEYLNPW